MANTELTPGQMKQLNALEQRHNLDLLQMDRDHETAVREKKNRHDLRILELLAEFMKENNADGK